MLLPPCTALETFLLFARRTEIFRVSLDVPELIDVPLPLANLSGATGLDWDDETDRIFWTDLSPDTINSANSDVSLLFVYIIMTHSYENVEFILHVIYNVATV